jgi:GNAT superfamily N-acetyltransferase
MNNRIEMTRDHLRQLPLAELPPGYHIRPYTSGDHRTWYEIHLKADRYTPLTPERFHHEFGSDDTTLAARQLYICDARGNALGTSTAWFDPDGGGRVHWVALVPEVQGRALSKPLLAATCRRLVELGHQRARLITQTPRIAAINLYLRFGFRPAIADAAGAELWRGLVSQLKPEFAQLILDRVETALKETAS